MLSPGYLLTDSEESIEGKKTQKGRKFRGRKKVKKKHLNKAFSEIQKYTRALPF